LVGLGYLEGILMISETTVMMLIAIQFGFMAFILMKLEAKNNDLARLKSDLDKSLNDIEFPGFDIEGIKSEIVELVEDLMASIRIPTIADHLGGIAQNFMQMKMVKMQADLGLMPESTAVMEEPYDNEDF
jgi:hypothetical protein